MKPEKPFFRTEYNYDRDEASNAHGLKCDDPSMAQQHFAEECDINTIVERFGLTGKMPQVLNLPEYGDYTGINDFQTAMNVVRQAQEDFMTLPAKLRDRFHHDPQEFLEFCGNEENRDEARKLGILREPEQPAQPQGPTNERPTSQTAPPTPQGSPGAPRAPGGTPAPEPAQKP